MRALLCALVLALGVAGLEEAEGSSPSSSNAAAMMDKSGAPSWSLVHRALSAVGEEANATHHGSDHDDDEHSSHGIEHFNKMFFLILFMCLLWLAGKASAWVGMPSLVGEISIGVVLGPHGLSFVPFDDVLRTVGEIGLILLVLEAGLHVDLEMLEIIGGRGLAVGLLGSVLPMCLAFTAAIVWGAEPIRAFVVAASMATMSTGIALNILKSGGVLNQPIGQLIIAAATGNEIVNIILITLVGNIVDGVSTEWYIYPFVIMFVLVAVIGLLAIYVIPKVLDNYILPRIPPRRRANAVLGLIFVAALILIPACKYSGSSELLGAFLAGFCFCTDHIVHETWDRQVKRVMHWLLRLFFAATIGFEIPIGKLFEPATLAKAAALCLCVVGKLAMGFFATPFDRHHFWILAFAWGEWGEFSFLIATQGRSLLDETSYNAIIVAVLVSIVACPYGLRLTLDRYKSSAQQLIAEAIVDTADVFSGKLHAAYFCVQTRSHAHWNQQDAILAGVRGTGCAIIDFRSYHPNDHVGVNHCVNELYVRDKRLKLPTSAELPAELEDALNGRVDSLFEVIRTALHDEDKAEVRIQRWLPGAHLERDAATGADVLRPNLDAQEKVLMLLKGKTYEEEEEEEAKEMRESSERLRDGEGKLDGKLVSGAFRFMIRKDSKRNFPSILRNFGRHQSNPNSDEEDVLDVESNFAAAPDIGKMKQRSSLGDAPPAAPLATPGSSQPKKKFYRGDGSPTPSTTPGSSRSRGPSPTPSNTPGSRSRGRKARRSPKDPESEPRPFSNRRGISMQELPTEANHPSSTRNNMLTRRPSFPSEAHLRQQQLHRSKILKRITVAPSVARALDSESLHNAYHVAPSHELDGFVHQDAHRPFELPDDRDHDIDDLLMKRQQEEDDEGDHHHHLNHYHNLEISTAEEDLATASMLPLTRSVSTSETQGLLIPFYCHSSSSPVHSPAVQSPDEDLLPTPTGVDITIIEESLSPFTSPTPDSRQFGRPHSPDNIILLDSSDEEAGDVSTFGGATYTPLFIYLLFSTTNNLNTNHEQPPPPPAA